MTKADLVEKVAEEVGPSVTKKDCGVMVDAFLGAVKDAFALAQGDRIELWGFGVFKMRRHKVRTARNPQTGRRSKCLRSRVDGGLGILGKEVHWEIVRES